MAQEPTKAGTALIIGRFQPFHNGHLYAVKTLCAEFETVLVGVGSAQYSGTPDNPFSFDERREMIQGCLRDEGLSNCRILRIDDLHDHPRWVAHVEGIAGKFDAVFSNDPLTERLFRERGFAVREMHYLNRESYMGKEIRRAILDGRPWEELVPRATAQVLLGVGAQRRLQEAAELGCRAPDRGHDGQVRHRHTEN